jgi:hypothetical protein
MYYFDDKKPGALYPIGVEKNNAKSIIYLHKGNQNMNRPKYNFSYGEYEKEIKKNGIKGRNKNVILKKLEEAYFRDLDLEQMETEDPNFRSLFAHVKEHEDKKSKYVADSKIIPILRPDWFNVVYINGASGSGKTKICVKMVMEYKKLNKKANVYLISKKEQDKMIDQIKGIERIDVTTFLKDPMTVAELSDKDVIIFDDFEGYATNKPLFKEIVGFMNDLMTMGRTKLLQVFIITHVPTFGKESSLIFQEMTYAVIYPTSMSYHALKFLLQSKIGFDTDQINAVKKMKSKYVVINRSFPRYVISGNQCELV